MLNIISMSKCTIELNVASMYILMILSNFYNSFKKRTFHCTSGINVITVFKIQHVSEYLHGQNINYPIYPTKKKKYTHPVTPTKAIIIHPSVTQTGAPPPPPNFKLLSINARGIADREKRRAIFDKHRQHADILIVQETHSTPDVETIWENEWGGKAIYAHGTSAARGVALFMPKHTFENISNVFLDTEGRLIVIDLHQDGQDVTIAAIYAPNKDCPTYFRHLQDIMKTRHEHKITIGDYNLTMEIDLDRKDTYHNNNKARDQVKDMMDQYKLKEIWRTHNPTKQEYSWIKKGQWPIKASRIDFALISAGIDQQVQMIEYISSVFTDHRAVYLVIDLQPFQRGTGYWKFNTSLLQNLEFLEEMRNEIRSTIQSSVSQSPKKKWEILKKRIKNSAIKFSRNNTSEQKLIIAQLSEKVNEYEKNLPLNRKENKLMEETKAELEDKTMDRIKGVMFRCKAKWYEEGERNTKYFFSLEKARYNAKTCYKLITEQGEEVNDQDAILEEQRNYYKKLYDIDKDVSFNLKNTYNVQVPVEIQAQQEEQILMKDLEDAIKHMNNNKTPGQDGIPVDFYKVFWTDIKQCFFDMVIDSYENRSLHPTARKGILNLIPKPNKDSKYIKTLRPITLLNCDYKNYRKSHCQQNDTCSPKNNSHRPKRIHER